MTCSKNCEKSRKKSVDWIKNVKTPQSEGSNDDSRVFSRGEKKRNFTWRPSASLVCCRIYKRDDCCNNETNGIHRGMGVSRWSDRYDDAVAYSHLLLLRVCIRYVGQAVHAARKADPIISPLYDEDRRCQRVLPFLIGLILSCLVLFFSFFPSACLRWEEGRKAAAVRVLSILISKHNRHSRAHILQQQQHSLTQFYLLLYKGGSIYFDPGWCFPIYCDGFAQDTPDSFLPK